MLLSLEREVYGITLGCISEGIDSCNRSTLHYALIERTVVPLISILLGEGLTGLFLSEVLIENIVQSLGVDSLSGPVDTESLEVETEVEAEVLGELEVLAAYSHILVTGTRLHLIGIGTLLVRIENQLQSLDGRVVAIVRRELQTSTSSSCCLPIRMGFYR